MPPQTVTLAIWLIQELVQHEPEIAASIKLLLTKADPTPDDWNQLHAKVAAKSYRDYVPATALPLDTPAAAAAPSSTLPPGGSASSAPEEVKIRVLPTPNVATQADKLVPGSTDKATVATDPDKATSSSATADAVGPKVEGPATLASPAAAQQNLTPAHLAQ